MGEADPAIKTVRRDVAEGVGVGRPSGSLRRILVPLALAQFICSFAGSNMNVMITDISKDLDTTVEGVQTAITVFLLVMAALMIPAGKLTDRWGRKRCFTVGLIVYGIGALMSAVSPGLGVLILGNSIFEGVGTALLIPPVYILTTMFFSDVTSRARAFGVITGMGGVGAAAGPLIGGLITTAISWRAAFVFQAVIVVVIVFLSRSIVDPVAPDPTRPFDSLGAVLSAAGLVFVVMGILAGGQQRLAHGGPVGCRSPRPRPLLRPHSRPGTQQARSRCCPPGSSGTAPPTSAWSRRTCSGCCSWEPRSSSRRSSRSFVATTPSRRA